jgi:hypothetical protein
VKKYLAVQILSLELVGSTHPQDRIFRWVSTDPVSWPSPNYLISWCFSKEIYRVYKKKGDL